MGLGFRNTPGRRPARQFMGFPRKPHQPPGVNERLDFRRGWLRGRWFLPDSTSPPARWESLFAAAGGAGFLDGLFDRFTGFARAFLNPANQFVLLAFGVLKIGKASCRERV